MYIKKMRVGKIGSDGSVLDKFWITVYKFVLEVLGCLFYLKTNGTGLQTMQKLNTKFIIKRAQA